jgi:hypothetical protein
MMQQQKLSMPTKKMSVRKQSHHRWLPRLLLITAAVLLRSTTSIGTADAKTLKLGTTLCVDRDCKSDCVSYRTPLDVCYNGQHLFPGDPSWGNVDVYDQSAIEAIFHRFFYGSQNSTCHGPPTDAYSLPVDRCLGPFGIPRPWGYFEYAQPEGEGGRSD